MDLNDMQAWHWFAIAGGGVMVLGVIAYFLPVGKMKIPAVVTTALGGLAAGLALGVLLMAGFGYKPSNSELPSDLSGKQGPLPGAKGAPKGKGPPGNGPKMNFGPPPPSPRDQLAALIGALDTVADRPLTLSLTPEAKAVITEQLKGLDQAGEVSDDEAKSRLDAIWKVVEKDQKTLEAVGYRSSPAPKGGISLAKNNPNPFKNGPAAAQLKSLLERLKKT